ncbi:MAG: Ig-like domain-containing protein, partial [Gemmatimonadales bacterium]
MLLLLIGGCPRTITDPGYDLAIAPTTASLFVDDSVQFRASLRDKDGADVPAEFTWRSHAPLVATVDAGGWVHGRGPGSAVVEVSAVGLSATATVSVARDNGRSIEVAPRRADVFVGNSVRFTAVVRDRHGDTIPPPATPAWTSSNAAVASIDAAGVARGIAPGSVTIRARVSDLAGEA